MAVVELLVGAFAGVVAYALWEDHKEIKNMCSPSFPPSSVDEVDDKEKLLAKQIAESFYKGEWDVIHTPENYTERLPYHRLTSTIIATAISKKWPSLQLEFAYTWGAGETLRQDCTFLSYEECLSRCISPESLSLTGGRVKVVDIKENMDINITRHISREMYERYRKRLHMYKIEQLDAYLAERK